MSGPFLYLMAIGALGIIVGSLTLFLSTRSVAPRDELKASDEREAERGAAPRPPARLRVSWPAQSEGSAEKRGLSGSPVVARDAVIGLWTAGGHVSAAFSQSIASVRMHSYGAVSASAVAGRWALEASRAVGTNLVVLPPHEHLKRRAFAPPAELFPTIDA